MELKENKDTRFLIYLSLITIFISIILTVWKPIQLTIVSGQSMYPTLRESEFLLMIKKSNIEKNSIVTFESDKAWKEQTRGDYIKRVLGVPGDTISVDEEFLYVNDTKILTFKDRLKNSIGDYSYTLKNDEYFLVGDNVGRSIDSLYRLLEGKREYIVNREFIKYSMNREPNSNAIINETRGFIDNE